MINVITVCVGPRYGPQYPNSVFKQVSRSLSLPHRFYCVTELTEGLADGIIPIRPTHNLPGWWNKLYLFSPLMPAGRLIYIDLDMVLIGDITPLVERYTGDYCGDEDHIHWGASEFADGRKHPQWGKIDCSLGTAFVSLVAHKHPQVWDYYLANRAAVEKAFAVYGDQVYTSWALKGKFDLWETLYPDHGIASYKFDILGQAPRHLLEKRRIATDTRPKRPEDCLLINFHGNPKPFDVEDKHPWLKSVLK